MILATAAVETSQANHRHSCSVVAVPLHPDSGGESVEVGDLVRGERYLGRTDVFIDSSATARRGFFDGMPVRRRGAEGLPDITWFTPDGAEMSEDDWDTGFGKAIAVHLNGNGIGDRDPRGQRVTDDSFIMLFNAHHEPIEFNLPPAEFASTWTPLVSTTTANGNGEESSEDILKSSSPVVVDGRSLMLLKAGADDLV